MTNSTFSKKTPWLIQCVADLARHEGFREFAYPDPLSKLAKIKADWGKRPAADIMKELKKDPKFKLTEKDGLPWTVGYGFTRGVKHTDRMSKQAADIELEQEIIEHLHVVDTLFPKWKSMPLPIQTVLVNMGYNLGLIRLGKFVPTIELINDGEYGAAALRLKNTAWYKQVGTRGVELVKRMATQTIDRQHRVI